MANNTNTRWEEFNAIIDDERLDAKEKGLLLILFRYVNYVKGYAEPSRSLIKKLYGTNKNDVLDKTMNSLIDKGFLIRQSGKGRRSNYFVKLGTQTEPSTIVEPSTQIEPIVGTQIEPIVGSQIEPQKEKKRKVKENIYSSSENEQLIEKLWSMYPSKIGKGKAVNKIPKLIKEYGYEELARAIERYKAHVEKQRLNGFTSLKYQNGSTFFNGGYIDYLDENYTDAVVEEKQETGGSWGGMKKFN